MLKDIHFKVTDAQLASIDALRGDTPIGDFMRDVLFEYMRDRGLEFSRDMVGRGKYIRDGIKGVRKLKQDWHK